jgi:hypothetical protein
MPNKFANDAVAIGNHLLLYSRRQISDAGSALGVLDRDLKRVFRNLQESLNARIDYSHRNRCRRIPYPSVFDHAAVDFDDVPILDPAWSADSVNYLLVHRNANMSWKLLVPEEGAFAALVCHEVCGSLIDLASGDSRANH